MSETLQKTLMALCILGLAVAAFNDAGKLQRQATQLEAQDRRLREMREGFNGLDALHDRLTQTQLEQIRLANRLDRAPKPNGSAGFPGERKDRP